MFGLSISLLPGEDFPSATRNFLRLSSGFPLRAAEIQTDTSLFSTAFDAARPADLEAVARVRQLVEVLGIHLPFYGINPVSADPGTAAAGLETLFSCIRGAAQIGADYLVAHIRAPRNDCLEGRWPDLLSTLKSEAQKDGLEFCLENADDLRWPSQVLSLAEQAAVNICLDTGHLFERLYEELRGAVHFAARLNDSFFPWPFLLKSALPAAEAGDWAATIDSLLQRIRCIHLHDHDGRQAHIPLGKGKTPWKFLVDHASPHGGVPIILEVDYRRKDLREIEADLHALAAMWKGAGRL